eukprot:gnl/MRDRNA2_/MRDRNA2_77273_c0_seq3.p1 gnl/MRDRNA2_/MRDRNA2_77273_c0~~gnl/MRDRNA2_/MRDRNA2_77273_c0_seq3.p1  ORF type:complete len:239 (+),score=28.07 gnl/MRDRNA2_/MRDRNA2_77273_c0_seq3:413-1129(+)
MLKAAGTVRELLKAYMKHHSHGDHVHLSTTWTYLGRLARRYEEGMWIRRNQHKLDPLLDLTKDMAREGISMIGARQLAIVAYSAARMGPGSWKVPLMEEVARAAIHCVDDFNAQEITNLSWGFAKVDVKNAPLFEELARVANSMMDSFNVLDLSNTAWAFAKTQERHVALYETIARTVEPVLPRMNSLQMTNLAWAFAKQNLPDEALFMGLAKFLKPTLARCTGQELADVTWSFAKTA